LASLSAVQAQDRSKQLPDRAKQAQDRPAQTQPKQNQDRPKYEVAGFRDARFGMTEQEVRALIVKAFGVKDTDIQSTSNPTEGTTLVNVRVNSLDPGPGPLPSTTFSVTRASD